MSRTGLGVDCRLLLGVLIRVGVVLNGYLLIINQGAGGETYRVLDRYDPLSHGFT